MKTKIQIKKVALSIIFLVLTNLGINAQSKQRIAIISMDVKGLQLDNQAMASLVNLELEKANHFELLDRYDVNDIVKKNEIDINSCFGKSCLVKVGQLLRADKMMTGSAEKFGNKIVIILKIIDVGKESIEITNVMEYIDQEAEMQNMIRISINNLLGIPNNQKTLDLLVNFEQPIKSPKTIVRLSGPRMGASFTFGEYGKRMEAPKAQGGYNMYPLASMFGYQFEKQYLSAGDFQALIEFIPAINGMESGKFIPSATFINGFRFNKTGLEFGLGPVFRFSQLEEGYYKDGEWKLLRGNRVEAQSYNVFENLDSRGDMKLSSGLIFALGKTFHSGYLNIPLNLYVSPRKEGTVIGFTFGFNISKNNRPQ